MFAKRPTNWRAGCEKFARPVRREGQGLTPCSYPYRQPGWPPLPTQLAPARNRRSPRRLRQILIHRKSRNFFEFYVLHRGKELRAGGEQEHGDARFPAGNSSLTPAGYQRPGRTASFSTVTREGPSWRRGSPNPWYTRTRADRSRGRPSRLRRVNRTGAA